ncbi:MAG: cbb3-type cytochrome c oxidase subunit 3 [Leptonema sp. (in: Bacteria)]|nr:cbb3-type cytochrome c oxidase subunit 3 [Leptonema sp. (in: bacteria)]
MEIQDLIGIYKGLRLPFLGVVLMFIAWYIYRPSKKKDFEEARLTMLDDDVDPSLSQKFRVTEEKKEAKESHG